MKMISKKQILDAANTNYPYHYLRNYYDVEGNPVDSHGDLLAHFIVHELIDVIDGHANPCKRLVLAEDAIVDAINDLNAVLEGIQELHRQQPGHEHYGKEEEEGDHP